MNSINLMGRVTKDITTREIVSTNGEKVKYCNFSLAVTTNQKNNEAFFINCVSINNNATWLENNIEKGDKIAVTGYLQQKKYKNNEGRECTHFEVVTEKQYFA